MWKCVFIRFGAPKCSVKFLQGQLQSHMGKKLLSNNYCQILHYLWRLFYGRIPYIVSVSTRLINIHTCSIQDISRSPASLECNFISKCVRFVPSECMRPLKHQYQDTHHLSCKDLHCLKFGFFAFRH